MSLLGDWAADRGYAAGWTMVQAMPESLARKVFDAAAIYAARGGGPEQLRRNLSRVVGAPPAEVPAPLMRAALLSYARYWREAFQLPTMDHVALGRRFDDNVVGKEHLVNGLAAGRGVVLALPHSGNWDAAGVWMTQTHSRFTTVVERLKPEPLYRRFVAYRESLGFEVLPLSGGQQPPFDLLCQRLTENRPVCLMAERDLTRSGVPVDFFGEPARMPAGPAKLAMATGAALLPSHCWFDGDGWGFQLHPPLDCSGGDVAATTQALADQFTEDIAAYPEDWHMLQPQWLADLSEAQRMRLGDV